MRNLCAMRCPVDKEAQSAAPADWGIILINREIEKIALFIGLAIMYHVSSFLYSILMGLLPRP